MEPNEGGSVESVAKKKKHKGKQKQDKKHHSGVKHRHKKKPRLDASGNEIIDISGEYMENDSQETVEIYFNDHIDSFDEMIEEATDAAKKAEEDAAKKAEEHAAKKAEEDAAKKAEEDAAKKAEEDAAKKAEEDAAKKAEEDAAKKAEEDAAKKAEEDAAAKKAEEDAAKKKEEEETKKKTEEDAAKKKEEEETKKSEEDAAKKAEEYAAAKKIKEETKQKIKEASQKVEEDIKKAREEANKCESQNITSEDTEENISYVINHNEKVPQLHEIYSENIANKLENTEEVNNPMSPRIPKLIFIVPYRDREQQLNFFVQHMKKIMEDYTRNTYKILYIHQKDERSFNRGAMKNIGFLYVKDMYPKDYKSITLVFNDVDTMPLSKNFLNYETKEGNVKHFYGYEFTLGGIVSITGGDFEKINGYANYWSWGYEDNVLQDRVLNAGLNIDRTQFYPIMDKNILQMKDGLTRLVNRGEFDKYEKENNNKLNVDGIKTIRDLKYDFDESTHFVNVSSFNTETQENKTQTRTHDMRQGSVPFKRSIRRPRMGMIMNKR